VRWTSAARAGVHINAHNKIYALAGYSYGEGPDGATVGAGVEHTFGNQYFTKVEYRHTFDNRSVDTNTGVIGWVCASDPALIANKRAVRHGRAAFFVCLCGVCLLAIFRVNFFPPSPNCPILLDK
jgi:hypothetical protein